MKKFTCYVLRTHDEFGVGYAFAPALQITNARSCIIDAKMFPLRESAECFLGLQSDEDKAAYKIVEFFVTMQEIN